MHTVLTASISFKHLNFLFNKHRHVFALIYFDDEQCLDVQFPLRNKHTKHARKMHSLMRRKVRHLSGLLPVNVARLTGEKQPLPSLQKLRYKVITCCSQMRIIQFKIIASTFLVQKFTARCSIGSGVLLLIHRTRTLGNKV